MKPTFLHSEKPLLTAMIQCRTPEECIGKIRKSLSLNADAFGIQLCQLKKQFRTEAILSEIFSACDNKPIYITSYRGNESTGMSDEECAELLLLGLKCGATLCDIIGDLFDQNDRQITYNENALQKQKELIDEIHRQGGEVLISTHDLRYLNTYEVMAIAHAQQEHGADIIKIVTKTDSADCLPEYIGIIQRLRKELNKPFLFLDAGANADFIRQVGPALGVCMYLCVSEHSPLDTPQQPILKNVKAIREHMLL